jgi:mxaJ protein
MIAALADGTLDVALMWAPQAGYFAHRQGVEVAIVPASDPLAVEPQAFAMSLGVRRGEVVLRDTLDRALAALAPKIDAVLRDYDVPVGDAGAPSAAARPHGGNP